MRIVVIEAFGLHLGYLGCYGNDWTGTPNLDQLAAEGAVFDWHYADQPELQPLTPWRERSVATGRYALPGAAPIRGGETPSPRVVRCESCRHFASQALHAVEGNDPWLWIEGPSLLPPWELDEEMLTAYFDEDDEAEDLAPWKDPPLDMSKLSEAQLVELQNTYAAVVTVFDAELGVLLERLREKKQLDDLLFCITARSGLPLGEHGMIGAPRPWLHDELVHLPLMMRLPGAIEAGMRIGALTQPIDLLPTFLESLRRPAPAQLHGRDLWPLLRGDVEEVHPYAVAGMRVGERESRMLRTLEWVLHVPVATLEEAESRVPRLFAKPEDRWEVNDLYQQQGEGAEEMEATLRAFAEEVRR